MSVRRRAALLLTTGLLYAWTAPSWAKSRNSSTKHRRQRAATVPVAPRTKDGLPNVQARAAIIADLDTGEELFTKNPDEVRPIASVGKLFLALVVREKGLSLEGKTVITEEDRKYASGGARSRLPVGKTFLNHDLLRAMLISSDNRACTALGRAIGLPPDKLIEALNQKAHAMGLARTKFSDPSGLRGNESTPRELLVALREALADPVIAEIMTTPTAVVRSVDEKHPVQVEYMSTDVSLRSGRREVLGGKTGYTDEAKYCLAIAAKLSDRRIGMVFLGADGKLTRFADFERGADWLAAGGKAAPAPSARVGAAVDSPPPAMIKRVVGK